MSRLESPANGVTVRMYRTGHGDCFLLAFPRSGNGEPIFVLVDCGYKPGSQNFIHGKGIAEVVAHIGEATNYRLDLVIVTHEHQDHLNGFWRQTDPYFKDFVIEEAWFAWTENPADEEANRLRMNHHDQVLGLVKARRQLALTVGDSDPSVQQLDALLSLEVGGSEDTLSADAMFAAATDPMNSGNKQAMKLVKEKASSKRGVRYLLPGDVTEVGVGGNGLRAFVLGPPRDEKLLRDEDPVGSESFPDIHPLSLSSAVKAELADRISPFNRRYKLALNSLSNEDFLRDHYGADDGEDETDMAEAPSAAAWRRIDADWLYSVGDLALKLNTGINNTSLVLAFELPQSKKVLLFPGDAQRGNWRSWGQLTWHDAGTTVSVRDLLARTVLYKVSHHGSHNATLAGRTDDEYPNIAWMGRGHFAEEFTAMITAVNRWAIGNDPPWYHPLPSIREALERKAQGRILQTDIASPVKPFGVEDADWERFTARAVFEELFIDITIADETLGGTSN